jgi:hypothetical protein
MVKFIQDLGCPLDLDKIVVRQPCGIAATGGFVHNKKNLPEGQYTPKVSALLVYVGTQFPELSVCLQDAELSVCLDVTHALPRW